jgi:mannose-6-phosphate isomerase-like protein (cupin superfamily)
MYELGASMDIKNIEEVPAFTTKDGSEIRELLAHRNSCIRNQTLAEARLPSGGSTTPHRHIKTEEIYFFLEGQGLMQIDGEKQLVKVGDAVAIPPGALHQVTNTGTVTLKFLCCCAPGYEHKDTILAE